MPYASHRFIDPRTLAAIADLHLAARAVVDGFMFGSHESRLAGAGLEFSQYRSYEPGDDLRRIDWRLYARSDRYYVREADAEMSLTVRFLLDTSESMMHEEDGLSKFDYARLLVAALGYLASTQGDEIGLLGLGGGELTVVPARRDRQALHRLLHALEAFQPGGVWPAWEAIEGAFTAAPRRELLVVVTDLHERAREITTALSKLSALRNDVVVLHVMSRHEMTFGYRGAVRFEELETGRVIEVDADRVRDRYLTRLERDLRALRHDLQNQRIAYALMRTDEPLDAALREFLMQRAHLR